MAINRIFAKTVKVWKRQRLHPTISWRVDIRQRYSDKNADFKCGIQTMSSNQILALRSMIFDRSESDSPFSGILAPGPRRRLLLRLRRGDVVGVLPQHRREVHLLLGTGPDTCDTSWNSFLSRSILITAVVYAAKFQKFRKKFRGSHVLL